MLNCSHFGPPSKRLLVMNIPGRRQERVGFAPSSRSIDKPTEFRSRRITSARMMISISSIMKIRSSCRKFQLLASPPPPPPFPEAMGNLNGPYFDNDRSTTKNLEKQSCKQIGKSERWNHALKCMPGFFFLAIPSFLLPTSIPTNSRALREDRAISKSL